MVNDNDDDDDDDDDRDAKSNLNSTDAKFAPQKLASNLLFFDIQPSAIGLICLEEAFLPIYIAHCFREDTTLGSWIKVKDSFSI